MSNLELTLEDCKNLLEGESLSEHCVILAHMHHMNPFDNLSEETIQRLHGTWKKIKDFVAQNE